MSTHAEEWAKLEMFEKRVYVHRFTTRKFNPPVTLPMGTHYANASGNNSSRSDAMDRALLGAASQVAMHG